MLKLDSMDYKIWDTDSKAWADHIGSQTDLRRGLKLIEKPMKEYLIKINGNYKLCNLLSEDATEEYIEIPEGAESYNQYSEGEVNNTFFLRMIGDTYYFANEDNNYSWEWYVGQLKGHEFILWQRTTSLNDQYAEIEKVRQSDKVLKEILEGGGSAWDTQVGGDHYKKYKIQPMLFALENNLNPLQHSVLKYIMRHEDKNGKQDLEKAKHYIDLMIAHYYPAE